MSEHSTPRIGQVAFEVYTIPDDSPVVPFRLPSESIAGFEDFVSAIKVRVAQGDMWAWCQVIVIGRYNEFSGVSSIIRQVSMSNAEDFVSSHPYFERLRSEAFQRLIINMSLNEPTFEYGPLEADPTH